MEEEVIFDFERRIREICEDNQMTRYELMNKAGLKHTSFYNMSNGKLTTPSLVSIKRICEVVDLDLASFFTYRGEGPGFTKSRMGIFMEINKLDDKDFGRLVGYYQAILEEKKASRTGLNLLSFFLSSM